MKNIQTVYLIYGPVASGKSTYARKLSAEKNAIRFAIDEWMHDLFGADRTEKMDMAWAMARAARCEARIWLTCTQILAAGRDVVLELGSMRERDRDRVKTMVDAAGHTIAFCFVDAEREIRQQRLSKRNREKGETYSFEVTPAMFDAMEMYFEPPSEQELKRSIRITDGVNHG